MEFGVIPFRLLLLIAISFVLTFHVTAQRFTTLHSFSSVQNYTNSDGAFPYAGLILSGNTLYGTAFEGGSSGVGTIFAIKTDGTGFTNLYSFTNSDGGRPGAGVILSGNTLYGTTLYDGNWGAGTVFAVSTNGTGFTNLHSFSAVSTNSGVYTNSDGANPSAGLILSGNTLYGTARYGGDAGNGTVFAVHSDGTGFTNLHSFTPQFFGVVTNSDGWGPDGLILSGNALYGTASLGGSLGNGTVFTLKTDGTGFITLYTFAGGNDGAVPNGELILANNTLYGTTHRCGLGQKGTVFALRTDGTGFRPLHSFTGGDGSYPVAGLIITNNTLYGTVSSAGIGGVGTVFALHTDGTGFMNLHNFAGSPSDGALPEAGLILSGNTLYGTTVGGGTSGTGTVFSLLLLPQLSISSAGQNVILTWPTNYDGFTLQSTTNLASPVWTTNLPAPVVVNGQNIVTNPITGIQQFFRLSQ